MNYQKVSCAVDYAWAEFYLALIEHGFTSDQVKKFAKELNYADVFNAVEKCAMEAVR